MGLCIIALDSNVRNQKINQFLKDYNIPLSATRKKNDEDLVDHLYSWCEDADQDYATIVQQKWAKDTVKRVNITHIDKYCSTLRETLVTRAMDALENIDDSELFDFNISYGYFHFMRMQIAKYFNIKWTDIDGLNSQVSWPHEYTTSRTGNAIINFFMHSDCDGKFDMLDVRLLNSAAQKLNVKQQVSKGSDPYKDEELKFLDFLQKSSMHNAYWKFC